MRIQLSDHFTYGRLIRFTLPAVATMLFEAMYQVTDGFFVSNYVGKTALAATSITFPFIMLFLSIGVVLGYGGNAYVSKKLGEGKGDEANSAFSLVVYSSIAIGFLFFILTELSAEWILRFVVDDEKLLETSVLYIRICLIALPLYMLWDVFRFFGSTAEKPKLMMICTVCSGFLNIILDYVFIAVLGWGIVGAALATVACISTSGGLPLLYFAHKNNSLLHLTRCKIKIEELYQFFRGGFSAFIDRNASSLLMILYNYLALRYFGENGVAAYSAAMYFYWLMCCSFHGYGNGIAGVVGFNYGAKNIVEQRSIISKSFVLLGILALFVSIVSALNVSEITGILVGYDSELHEFSKGIFSLCVFAVLFVPCWALGTNAAVALGDGPFVSKVMFIRKLILEPMLLILLPILFGKIAVFWTIPAIEIIGALIFVCYFYKKRLLYTYESLAA